MQEIKPTYLYIKQHSITGLQYFGCTTRIDVVKYNGSGSYWSKHIKKHNRKFVKTLLVIGPYTNSEELKNLALYMSEELDVVASDKWANLISEDGLGCGNLKGYKHSSETREKMSKSKRTLYDNGGTVWNKDKPGCFTEETLAKIGQASLGNNYATGRRNKAAAR